jgi:hypothetical protein
MNALAEVKQEWKHFRDDRPGERFSKHRERMKQKPRSHNAVALGLGVLLVVGGGVLLFMPGPGSLLIVFGLGLIASHSRRLAGVLDRAEPRARSVGRRVKRTWRRLSQRGKVGVVVGLAAVAAGGMLFMWRFVVSAYLLG